VTTVVEPPFLTAEWHYLAMLNYAIDPDVVRPLVPAGCELDFFRESCFVSVVGFHFGRTRVRGVPIPFHRNFEEVNLRFYVRRHFDGEWRRGVVFVKELVPRAAIAWVARNVYGENYTALPMRHRLPDAPWPAAGTVEYRWRRGSAWEGISVDFDGEPATTPEDSEASFITEHYWGYAAQATGGTVEYRVEHPRWQVWRATRSKLDCDVAALYGDRFVSSVSGAPTTSFVADGSAVVVRRGRKLA
jgi:hypothetical protein